MKGKETVKPSKYDPLLRGVCSHVEIVGGKKLLCNNPAGEDGLCYSCRKKIEKGKEGK